MTIHYMGVTDIARMLGVTKATISAADLPEPDVMIGRARGWSAESVDEWIRNRPGKGAGAGRPRKQHD